ncbi:MAG: PaaI family thioesterase [Alphaproteobacteria bacterium]|nr:PaaI family thioesterase [Alphaproteobacteria bacterium]
MASAKKAPASARVPLFGHTIGYKIKGSGPEGSLVTLRVQPKHLNRSGVVHGGVLMTLIDVACSVAGQYRPPDAPSVLSASISITTSFVGNVDRGTLIATGKRTGGGNRIFFAKGEVRDAKGTLIAQGEGVFRYRSPEATAVAVSRARAGRRRAAASRSER